MRREVADIKERVTGAEGIVQGGSEVKTQQAVTFGQVVAVATVTVAAFGILAAVVIAILN